MMPLHEAATASVIGKVRQTFEIDVKVTVFPVRPIHAIS
jgi:hypothetical protein